MNFFLFISDINRMIVEKHRQKKYIKSAVLIISVLIILYCIFFYNKFTSIERTIFIIGCFFVVVTMYIVLFHVRNERIIWLAHLMYPILVFLALFLVSSTVGYILIAILLLLAVLSEIYYGQCIIELYHSYNGNRGENYHFFKITRNQFLLLNMIGLMILLYRYSNSSQPAEFILVIYLGVIYFIAEIIVHNFNFTTLKKKSLFNSNFSSPQYKKIPP